jgi:iron complex outermembrane receptor protein
VPAGLGYYLGAHPEATAKTLANLWTRYTLASGPLKGLWIGGGFNYTGVKAQRLNNKALFLPATTVWNSALGYDWNIGKIKTSWVLNWENMTNEVYYPANQQLGLPERIVASVTIKY